MNIATGPSPTATEQFFAETRAQLAQRAVTKLVLAGPRGDKPDLQRVLVRPIVLKGRDCLSLTYNHRTRDVTRNLAVEEGLAELAVLIDTRFDNLHLLTAAGELQLAISRKGKATLRRSRAGGAAPAATEQAPSLEAAAAEPAAPHAAQVHDRAKRRPVDINAPFLVALGITDAEHRLIPAMARKWKQINKFIEVLAHALAAARLPPAKPLRVMDFGAGKGYLTFAVHDHLRHALGLAAEVRGVELREDLVTLCNGAAARLGLQGLHFEQGDVRHYAPGSIDLMIALHACDTATDHAMHMGVRSGAAIIMCSPCCHKELRPRLTSPRPLLPMLQHGIHLGQQAEMLTDTLRALLLEAEGYDTQVFEFTSLEHTSKNKMILAVKRERAIAASKDAGTIKEQVREIKRFYGVEEQCLETLLLQGQPGEGDPPTHP